MRVDRLAIARGKGGAGGFFDLARDVGKARFHLPLHVLQLLLDGG